MIRWCWTKPRCTARCAPYVRVMAGHSIKLSAETYAHVVLAASARRQTLAQWLEEAAHAALKDQDYQERLTRYRQAERHAAQNRQGAPLARDYGLSPHQL